MFFKIDVLKNFADFTEKYVLNLFLINLQALLKKKLPYRCFSMKFAKFVRAPSVAASDFTHFFEYFKLLFLSQQNLLCKFYWELAISGFQFLILF